MKKILIVEDDPIVADHIKRILQHLKYDVIGVFAEGDEALNFLKDKRADLVLMDINLKGNMDGIETAYAIKTYYDIPIIFLTAFSDEDTLNKVKKIKPSAFIIKPFQERELEIAVDTALFKYESEKKIKESEERYNALFDSYLDIIYVIDLNGNFIDANSSALKLFELTKEEIKKLNISNFINQEQFQFLLNYVEKFKRNNVEKDLIELRIKSKNKTETFVEATISLIFKNDVPHSLQIIGRDITRRKIAEAAISNLAAIVESSKDTILSTTLEGIIISWNKGAEEMYGYFASEIIGKNVSKLSPPEKEDDIKAIFSKIKSGKQIENFETTAVKKDGSKFFVSLTISPIKNSKGKITSSSIISRDITENKKTLEALQTSEKKYKDIFQFAPIGIFQADINGYILTANHSLAEILGFNSTVELTSLNLSHDIFLYKELFYLMITQTQAPDSVLDMEARWKKKDNEPIWVQLNVHSAKDNSNNEIYYEGFVRDITEQKKSQEQIRILSLGIEQSPASIIITDIKGKIEYVNSKFTQLTGYNREEVIGKTPHILSTYNLKKEESLELLSTINSGKVWHGEFLNRKKNGELYWESASISPIMDSDGKITHYLSVQEDITFRKIHEKELIQAKENAEKSDRLKTEFLAQMSHEIRTPLNNILTYTSVLKEEFEDKLPVGLESTFQVIDSSSQRLIRTIELILNLSRIQTGNFEIKIEKINLEKDLLEDIVLEFYSRAKSKNLDLIFQNEAEKFTVNADKYSLGQVFINLIDNAIKYTQFGKIKIRIYNREENVYVDVQDTGIGISNDYLSQLFNPFSQEDSGITRHYEGIGLGLALVKKYTELNNAEIKVESHKGIGSTFTVKMKTVS